MDKKKMNQASALSAEAVEARRAYNKEWRRKNPEKVRAINNRYWEKKVAKAKIEQQKEAVKQ